ncbi:UV DNA damage repair endonuclease UvsE [Cohnella nanjingensis]|uniref:UV DNA damage repair endonuclease UvsE n=1 Tax=Cohnella nanjingensis TaxID=1387779 RepID=A0A7X0VF99_9BACL|nr:UV DNA damage repair endonuclease UvsE [Cohnella nanjingensis]MBB6671078.1 UV DNA damage repair endonuclease UvsE [Cohnella nanjingensis]
MIVRFGFVAMSVLLENASPSRTMTYTNFAKLADREAGLRRLERLAEENLQNTLRLLKHCKYSDVKVYRMTSKLIPLATHERMQDWNPYEALAGPFAEVGAFVRENGMRVSFHPEHFTVFSTPRGEVLRNAIRDLDHHVRMLEMMGLDERATCNIHVGGAYGDKEEAGRRFLRQFGALEPRIHRRMTLENGDKTFTAAETLALSEETGVPMVLDLHHHAVNPGGERAEALWDRIQETWVRFGWNGLDPARPAGARLPPKMHVSTPKSLTDPRGHADHVDPAPLLAFLRNIAGSTPAVDVMIEAKRKDEALMRLMAELQAAEASGQPVRVLDGASAEVAGGTL